MDGILKNRPTKKLSGWLMDTLRITDEGDGPEEEWTEESEEVFEKMGVPRVSQGEKWASQAENTVSHGENGASHGDSWGGPRMYRTVPDIAETPLWWAKAARNVGWRWDRPVRALLSTGGAVVAVAVGLTAGGWAAVFAAVAAASICLLLDPVQIFSRRVAIQTRALAVVGIWILAFVGRFPSVQGAVVFALYAILAAVLARAGNEQWVVETNYCSSSELYTAFRNNPTESSHQALKTNEQSIFTYWYDMGVPPKHPLEWALACGTFCLGWLAGRRSGLAAGQDAEDEEEYEEEDGDDEELAAEMARLEGELGESQKEVGRLAGKLQESQADVRSLEYIVKEKREQIAELERQIAELEQKLLEEKDDGYREKLLWYEYHGMGNRSARDISRNTGIPKSTVQRWMAKQETQEAAAEDDD